MRVHLVLVGALTLFALGLPVPTLAQRATLTGKVTDPEGAAVPGVAVTLVNVNQGLKRETVTDGQGQFAFALVPPGRYSLTAQIAGFTPHEVKELVLDAGAERTVDIRLQLGGFSEEVEVSFTARNASSALRFDAPVRDIPLSVKSYTSSFIKAIETREVADLYAYMTGVSRTGDTVSDFAIRGLRAGVSNMQYNGVPGVAGRRASPPVSNVERIEVLKGPASVLYGQAGPGGIINIITKRPLAERSNTFDVRGGSFIGAGRSLGDDKSYRLAGDFTGPFDKNRKYLYRLVVSHDNINSYRDFVTIRETYVVPSLSWRISDSALLTIELEYRHSRVGNDMGLAAPRNDIAFVAPVTTRYQEPDDFAKDTGKAGSLFFNKLFQSGLAWSLTFRSVFQKDRIKAFQNVSIARDNVTLSRRDRDQRNDRKYDFVDTNLKKMIRTGAVEHRWLFGLNGGYELSDLNRAQFSPPGLPINLYAPVYGLPGLPLTPGTWRRTSFYNTGIYLQDQIVFSPRWKGLAALRYDRQDTSFRERRDNSTLPDKHSHGWLPMVGAVFQPTPQWSLYSSYTTSYTPATPEALDASGRNTFEPERGRQFEGGVKAELGNGKVGVTAAYFHIEKDNVLNTVAGVTEAFGQLRSRGMDLDLLLQPIGNLQLIAGYAYADSIISKDKIAVNVGARGLNAPKHGVNFWSRYDLRAGALKGLGLGLGIIHQSDRAGSTPVRPVPAGFQPFLRLPAFTRVDASAYYVRQRYEVTFKVTNLLDERYYEGANSVTSIIPGTPREGTLSLRVRF